MLISMLPLILADYMIHQILKDRPTKLFVGFAAFFVANALIAECIGGKIFSLEKLLGFEPVNLTLFGQSNLSLSHTFFSPVAFLIL